MKILIMREDWQAGLACIQSLGRRGHEVLALSSGGRSDPARSDYLAGLLPGLAALSAPGRAQALCDLVQSEGFDLVIPISDTDACAVARAAEMQPQCRAFVTPSLAAVETVRDRNRTAALCDDLGVHMPLSRRVTRHSLAAAAAELGFPCFLKLSQSAASSGVFELADAGGLDRLAAHIPVAGEAQLQERVAGDFVGITGFCREGELVDYAGFRAPYAYVTRGTPAYAWVHDSPEMTEVLRKIARRLNWNGGIDLDFLERPDGRLALLEINPRLSGTVNIALAQGRDLPALYLEAVGASKLPMPFAAQHFDVFVSLAEEARARKRPGGVEAARQIRANWRLADNGYGDDMGYARALNMRLCGLRLEEWGLGLGRQLRLWR